MTKKCLDSLWELYKPSRVDPLKTASEEVRKYETLLRPAFGRKRVDKLKIQDIEVFKLSLVNTPYQYNRCVSTLSAMLRYAEALQWIPYGSNPCKFVKRYTEKKRRRHVRREEAPIIFHLLNLFESRFPRQVLLTWLMIFTGARPSELMRIKWGDIKDNVATLTDHKSAGKTGTPRTIAFPPAAMEILNRITGGYSHADTPIIGLHTYNNFWQTQILKEGKLTGLRLYDLRHTFATYALAQGYSLDQIGEALEHANPATTKIYAEMSVSSRNMLAYDTSMAILKDMNVVREEELDVFN